MYAVVVRFEVKPDSIDQFKPLMLKQAENSLNLEPECKYFDVAQDDKSPHIFYLYELYTNKEAFDAHLNSNHFLNFIETADSILTDKEILTANRLN